MNNKEMITKYVPIYKDMYFKQFNEIPVSWFTFLKWLSSWSFNGSFNREEIALTEKLLIL